MVCMSAYIRLQNFITSAQLAYNNPQQQHLVLGQGEQIVLQDGIGRPLTSAEVQDQNRRTWNTFTRSLRDVIGTNKVQEICNKFRFNIQKMEREGLPLLAEHIELFSIGASRMMTRDIKQRVPQQHLRELTVAQLEEKMRMVNPFPVVGWSLDPREISGTPTNFLSWFFHDARLMDKETQLLFSDVRDLSFPAWQERFCKCIVNRELAEKQVIPAPGANGRVEYYKVHRKVATGDGLVAYALKPIGADSTLKPIVLFRPSQFALSNEDAMETYMNDVQGNIGEMGYLAARNSFNQLMNDPKFCPDGTKIEVAGYSLGGAHAQRFVADQWRKVSSATFYNDPSVDCETAERFARELNAAPRFAESIRLNIFRTKGDIAHHVGERHLGWGVTHPDAQVQLLEFDHQNREISLLQLHGRRVFDNPYRNYHVTVHNAAELNDQLDNERRGPAVFWYEKMRKCWGTVAFWLLFGLREVTKFFSAFLGIKILRSSKRTY